jgi:photosystem II stability/assembly factor-like uncharacterized protein
MEPFDDVTPDEREEGNLRVLQDLQRLYPPRAFIDQRLAGVGRRLASTMQTVQTPAQEQGSTGNIRLQQPQYRLNERKRITDSTGMSSPPTRAPRWRRRVATLGGGLCAALLVGAFILVLNMAHHNGLGGSGQPKQQIANLTLLHMLDASNGWALTKTALLRTTDGGAHWKDVTPPRVRLTDGSAAAFLNATQAWIAVPSLPDPRASIPSPVGPRIFSTGDGGQSWQSSVVPVGQGNLNIAQMTFATAQDGWLLFNQGGSGGAEQAVVVRTTDGGKTWAEVTRVLPASTDRPPPGKLPFGGTKTGIVFSNAALGWITGSDSVSIAWLFVTRDGGQTWTQQQLSFPKGVPAAPLSLLPPRFFSASEGLLPARVGDATTVIYVTHDGGTSWQPTTPVSASPTSVAFLDGQHGWVTDGTALFATGDGGRSWTRQPRSSVFKHVTQLDFVSDAQGWAISSGGVLLYTTDGGRTWA